MILFNIAKYDCLKSCAACFNTSASRFKMMRIKKAKVESEYGRNIRIWKKMTVWDLAKSLRKNTDYIEKVITPSLEKCINANGVILNLHDVQEFLIKEGILRKNITVVPKLPEKTDKVLEAPVLIKQINNANNVKRPPVVAIMGHVDHGKTTLLDALRSSNIVAGEAGGITQHIGAFSVSVTPKDSITFIDTPGHAAFRNMRNRGATVTDIVVLIVAADDGVMEQTIESIKMAQNAGAKIIVAVNKIDKAPEGNLAKIKKQLINYGLQAEDLGGNVQVIGISALKKKNLDKLVEAILLEADVMDLNGDPDGPFEGIVIESFNDKRGKLATVLVTRGTLRKRAVLLAGKSMAKVKFMFDENGVNLSEVTLSRPARVGSWSESPDLGEKVFEAKSEKEAIRYIGELKKCLLNQRNSEDFVVIQEKSVEARAQNFEKWKNMLELRKAGNYRKLRELNMRKKTEKQEMALKFDIIIKGDTNGSVDAMLDVLSTYNCTDLCMLNVISHGVGNVTEHDLKLAEIFNAMIYCFNLSFPHEHKQFIIEKNIRIKFHDIIYKFLDDLKTEISSILPLQEKEIVSGTGEVLQHFTIKEKRKKMPVGGCVCTTGEFKKDLFFKVLRNGEVIHQGKLKSMKHFKNEVKIIKKDQQCGIMFQGFEGEFKTGDEIICYEICQINPVIPWDPGF